MYTAIETSPDGTSIRPELHDASIDRIDFRPKELVFYCTLSGDVRLRVSFTDVVQMVSHGIAEQNIILDLARLANRAQYIEALALLMPGESDEQRKGRDRMLAQVEADRSQIWRFSPSYGGEILVMCGAALYECDPPSSAAR